MTARARNAVIGVVVAVALAAGALFLFNANLSSEPTDRSEPGETSPSVTLSPETPAFRFAIADRAIVHASRGHLSKRERRTVRDVLETVRSLVTDLYAGAFLDPARWSSGDYDDAFGVFSGAAREEARRRTGILTAGEDAGARFDSIEPVGGRLALRILLDRGDNPILVASVTHFQARASGTDDVLIRSDGSYLFRRIDGAWRIVSFDVERADQREDAA